MSDIITELRERSLRAEQEGDQLALLDEAAAEIERLRLTDAERTAIQRLVEDFEQDSEPASAGVVATLQRLLERTK